MKTMRLTTYPLYRLKIYVQWPKSKILIKFYSRLIILQATPMIWIGCRNPLKLTIDPIEIADPKLSMIDFTHIKVVGIAVTLNWKSQAWYPVFKSTIDTPIITHCRLQRSLNMERHRNIGGNFVNYRIFHHLVLM